MKIFQMNTAAMIGQRIQVIGNSASGKSTLAQHLANLAGSTFVELDALNWLPNWYGLNEHDPEELDRRIIAATKDETWVLAGSYMTHCQRTCWERLQTIIWLDLPMHLLVWRVLQRSWKRWRSQELLWGTNYENFWHQVAVWRKEDSLVWWIVTQHQRKRTRMIQAMSDPKWAHIKFIRLISPHEVTLFVRSIESNLKAP